MKLPKKYGVMAACLIAVSVLLAAANTSQPLIVEQFIDQLGGSDSVLIWWGFLYFLSIFAILIIEMGRKVLEAKYAAELKDWLREKISEGILNRSPKKFAEQAPQEYISVMNNDVPAVVEEYYLKIVHVIFQIISIAFTCVVLTKIYFPLALVSAVTSILIAVIPFFFKTGLQNRREKSLEGLGTFNVKFSDVVFGFSEIRVQQIRKAVANLVALSSKDSARKEFAFERMQAWSEIVIGFVSFMGTFLMIVLGGYQVHRGQLDIGSLFAAIQLSDQLIVPIIGISSSLNAVVASVKVKEKLFSYGKQEEEKQKKPIEHLESIRLENLSLKFGDKFIFKEYSQNFEQNKKYLIIGQNGSGKSSLVHLISGDLVAGRAEISGRILVNGRERKDIFDGDFFRELTIISQVPYLFSGTVKNNLTLFDGLKTEKLKEIPLVTEEMTGLLEDDRFVSNESAHISSGEREKMAIIRALLKESRWLILDEATAALDRQSKKMFEEYLLKRKDLTVIHISHTYREEDKENYDEVIRIGE